MRSKAVLPAAAVVALVFASAAPCFAQFGIGGRMSMIRNDTQIDTDSLRFFGGQLRARTSPHTGLELSLDYRNESNEAETIKVRDMPIQASLLIFLAKGGFAPFLVGGGGWYNHRVEVHSGNAVLETDSTHEFGWHTGFGAEVRAASISGSTATIATPSSAGTKTTTSRTWRAAASCRNTRARCGLRALPYIFDGPCLVR